MKTAKEVCEEVSNLGIDLWIKLILKNKGNLNTHPYKYYSKEGLIYYKGIDIEGLILPNKPNDLILNKLQDLGYKIQKLKAHLPTSYKVHKHFFYKEITPVIEELEWVEISACCGEENESN